MYSSVLLPVDGSEFGQFAAQPAAVIAQRLGVPLRLVHVVPSLELRLDADQRHEAAAYLDRLAGQLRVDARVEVQPELLEGDVVPTLLKAAEQHQPALIVLTTHGRGGLQRAVLGSVADALVRRSAATVLAVRPTPRTPWFAEGVTERVLLPLDGSERDEEIFDHAQTIGRAVQAELLLLRVLQPKHDKTRPPVRQIDRAELRDQREVAEKYLARIAEHLARFKLPTTVNVAVDDDPAQGILDVARREKVGLIAMATRGRGGLERLREGSVADRVLRGTEAAVLLFRATG